MHVHLKLEFIVLFCLPIVEGSFLYGGTTYDQTCSSDCSQKSPVPFKCDIKGKEGWELFEKKLKTSYDVNDYFGAPIMTSVDWYLKRYSGGLNPSLNVSFTVPDDSIQGVLLEFSSPSDLRVQDVYYHENRKFRLFEINHIKSIPFKKPISIFYDCMIGLDENDFRVYEVTLQSLPGARATYYVTTYYQGRSAVWKPAIATSTSSDYSIYVVFEAAPPEMNASEYNVDLVNLDDKMLIQSHQIRHPDLKTTHTFQKVNPGKYYVQIEVYGYSPSCPKNVCTMAISWNVTIPGDGYAVLLENQDFLTKILISLASVAGLVILVVSVMCYVLRARQKHTICCCMSGTSSGMDPVNNLNELKTIRPLNGGEEEATFFSQGIDEKTTLKCEPETQAADSQVKPSDKSNGPKDNMQMKDNNQNSKLVGDGLSVTHLDGRKELVDVHVELNKSSIADDTGVPHIQEGNSVKQAQNISIDHSLTADDNEEGPSHPLIANDTESIPIYLRNPECRMHSRLPTNARPNMCPVHGLASRSLGSTVHQQYCQLIPQNSRAQPKIHVNELSSHNHGHSSAHRRENLEYRRFERELMRINSLYDVSEV